MNADSVAMLTSLSPLGDKYLEITTGTNKARRLPGGATIPSTEPVSLDDLAKQASASYPPSNPLCRMCRRTSTSLRAMRGLFLPMSNP